MKRETGNSKQKFKPADQQKQYNTDNRKQSHRKQKK